VSIAAGSQLRTLLQILAGAAAAEVAADYWLLLMETVSALAGVLRKMTEAIHGAKHLQVSGVFWHPIFKMVKVQSEYVKMIIIVLHSIHWEDN
jgi:hypothetical protein